MNKINAKILTRSACLIEFGLPDSESFDAELLRKAYKEKRVAWHPDKHPDDVAVAQEKFKELEEMYDFLMDLVHVREDLDHSHSTPPSTPRPSDASCDLPRNKHGLTGAAGVVKKQKELDPVSDNGFLADKLPMDQQVNLLK